MDDTKRIISKQILVDTANAIRAKKGTSETMSPSNFANEIASIETQKPTQTKTVEPSKSQQIVEPDEGYELSSVTVNAVTSSIDANIKPQNIAKNVTILGVTGNHEAIKCSYSTGRKTLPEEIFGAKAAIAQGIAYIFGGYRSGYTYEVNHILKYDIEQQTSSIVQATLPILDGTANFNLIDVAVLGTDIYLFISGTSTIYIFDTITETISEYSKKLTVSLNNTAYVYVSEGYIYVMNSSVNKSSRKLYVLGPENGENTYFIEINESTVKNVHSIQVVGHTVFIVSRGNIDNRLIVNVTLNSGTVSNRLTDADSEFNYIYFTGQRVSFAGTILELGDNDYSKANCIKIACPQNNYCKQVTIEDYQTFSGCATVVYGNTIYCFGGRSSESTQYSNTIKQVELYIS